MATSLSILNDPPKVLEGPRLLHRLIPWDQQLDACALDCTSNDRNKSYTYRKLLSCADSLQARIQDSLRSSDTESSKQHIVPVLLPQSPGLYISQLAILRFGGAFCPINLDAPKERIKFVVGDVSANLIITTSAFKDTVSWEDGPKVILVDEFPEVEQEEAVEIKGARDATPGELAYVMYTSGSSGKPKGVAVSHLAVSQSLLAHERHIPHFKRFLQFAAPSFDVSVFEIFFPLIRGATLVGCDRSQLLNDLPGMINKLNIDAAELTPTVVGSLLQKRSNAPGLKLLLTIGEMLTRPIVEEFGGSKSKPNMLYGMYGPTEAAIHCTIYPKMEASAKPGNIGIPFDTVSTFIAVASESLDDAANLKFLPVGELGELVLSGPQLAHCYLNRPDQNKAAFVKFEGRNYYRTGDKARQLENGTIEILGRISAGQVKLRGQRVELGEIEEAVYKHSGVKTVAAVVLANALLVFALVDDANIKSEDVMKTCSEWLPKFMIPSEIILLQKFPYLPSGKVDKRKLESDYQEERANMDHDDSTSASKTEQSVKNVLHEVLGPFPSTLRLAAAGLDSLRAIQVASKLRSQGYAVSTIAVLQADTFASLARICETAASEPPKSHNGNRTADSEMVTAVLNGHAKDVESSMPCTPLQTAMLSETAIDQKAYRNWVELDLAGIDDTEHVIQTLQDLAQANPILRTGFSESQNSDGYVQVVWRSLTESHIEEVEEFEYGFNKSKDTSLHHPLRVQILQVSSGTKVLIHLHHALYDAWSLELLLDDLDALLKERPIPDRTGFRNVVDAYTDGRLDVDDWGLKDYWKDYLAHLELGHMPNFHTEMGTPPALAVTRWETSISMTEIEKCSRSLSVSPQSLFQTAYALLLGSYLGSSDICFGSVFSGRTLPIAGIEDIVGPCLATLPIRIDLSTSTTLRDLVQELNAMTRKHLENSILPLRDIKSCSGVDPLQLLFDTLLIWQQTLHDIDHKREHVSLVNTLDNLEFNLTLEIIPTARNIELKANYQRALFPESQINLLLRSLEQLLRVILDDSSVAIDSTFSRLGLNILSAENETPDISLKGETLSSPVERIAAEDPDRPAIDFARSIDGEAMATDRVSYFQLNSRSNQMGSYLSEQNVLPDELVCICMEKCNDLYVSILATAKIGAGYLPLTPDVPPERLEHILREANVKVVMAQSVSRPIFKSLQSVKVVYVDEVKFGRFSAENIPSRSSPNNVSYCVFTSGSTGTPKGVLVTQGNLLSNLDVLQELYPTSSHSRFLQSCSQAFDVSVFEIFFAWRVGGCICSAIKDVLFQDIENAICAFNVTHLSLTPTVAALINPENVPKVQFLVTAGEAVTQKVFNVWANKGLWQGYGPSETTNICTVNPRVSQRHAINNIGPPFKNTSAFVLAPDQDFSLVPRGGVGEFCFGGSQIFRGYMDRTQEVGKIIEHPQHGKLYRSGDFGRLMPDGSLAFTGRKDDQVKIRGQRVELGEISNIMLRSDEVKDCVTIVIDGDTDNSQRLVCFWVSTSFTSEKLEFLKPEASVVETLYTNLESALPAYMIPSALIPISVLPATAQGKIDKRRLVKHFHELDVNYLDMTTQGAKESADHTWTDLENKIADAVARVTNLSRSELHPDTSFFNLGIDSISAISLSRTLRQTLDLPVEISDILKFPSVTRLSQRLLSRLGEDLQAPREVQKIGFDEKFRGSIITRFGQAGKSVQAILPCTPLQEAMLSAAEASAESLYDNKVMLQVNGNVQRLQACWREMVRRHEILRTCFVSTDMKRHPYVQAVLECHDLVFGVAAKDKSLQELEPPYSLDLLESSGSYKLSISMHHALYDGVALTVLYEEVESLYRQESLPQPVSFAPFLQAIEAMDLGEADQFWGATLQNCRTTAFKASRKTSMASQQQSKTRVDRINAKNSLQFIESSIKKHSTSLLGACHAAWAALLSEKIQETDVCFGNVVSGRTIPVEGVERLVAPCFNTIPARLQNTHNLTYLEAFRKLQSLNADSIPFQLTPLRRIQSKFSPDGSRLFDTLFILQQPPRPLDSSIWAIEEDSGAMDFPLVCEVVPKHSDDTLEIILHSYTNVISDAEAVDILRSFEEKLKTALENPRRQLLSATVRDEILAKVRSREEKETKASNLEGSSKPMSKQEEELRDVIAAFTDVPVDKIGRDVSIFRLGLDSISTVQVATRLRKQGHTVLASDILEHPTIVQLSGFLWRNGGQASQVEEYDFEAFDKEFRQQICAKNGINAEEVEAVRPCTAVQQGMLAQTMHSRGQEYVNSVWFEVLPDVDVTRLKQAWAVVCESHEMLRTGFCSTEDSKHPFVMVTYSSKIFPLPWIENELAAVTSERLAQQPWTLLLSRKDNTQTIRFTAHHALYDAQSIQMILEDVAKVYKDEQLASRPPLVSMLGSILRHTQDDVEAKQQFWQRDENKIVVNRLPDLTPLRVSDTSSAVREVISKATITELEAECRKSGVTIQAVSQAAWARILAAYIGETATTFGMTLSGRSVSEDADKISFPSIVTLPVRCDVTGSNGDLLARTMKSNALLHKHQFTPLTSIQKWAGYPEGKIFDTLFAYQKLPNNEDKVTPPWKVVKEEASVDYAVSLEVQPESDDTLMLRLTFRQDLIPVEHAELILRQYDAMLVDLLQNPQSPCDVIPELENELLSIMAAEEDVLPGPVTLLHEFVERGAKTWSEKTALEFATCLEPGNFKSRSWTYNQLDQEANKVAHLLLKHGVVPGEIVAICFDKCAEASFATIGVLKVGCAFVALDLNAPADRLKFIVGDSAAKLVLTAGKPGQDLRGLLDREIISLDSSDVLAGCSNEKPELARNTTPDDTAYCLYTSGTTGTPKGCLITHDNTVQFMLAFSKLFAGHWSEDSKYLQFASFHFDVSVMEQFWSWSVGICVASAPRDLIFEDITGAIQQLQITHIDLTPSLARLIHPDDVPTLCQGAFITGGEQLKQEILDLWGERAVIYNGYGPTEATIGCTMYPRVPKNGKPTNIGPAYINVGSYVLKPGTEIPVLRGGIGELCVSGRLVGKGYLNRPDLTAERFPTLKAFDERVYRTGDLVRILHDGSFIFLGRADDQVKLRGQRLELSEINEVIKKGVRAVEEVVTLVLKHVTQQKEQLVTFFVASSDGEGSTISTMRGACKSRLPGYMVPTHFIPIKKLPLNANNKADSKQLAAMYNELGVEELQMLSQSGQDDKKWPENEKSVLEILARVLDVEAGSLTRSSNIFELGLDSISIIGFSRALQNSGLENAKLSVVKSNPSIGGLVRALVDNKTPDKSTENAFVAAKQYTAAFSQRHMVAICKELSVESEDVESVAPCTPVQEGMIYRFLESELPLYFNKFEFELDDGVDVDKLVGAWERVIRKLEVLRTKFVATDDGFAQAVLREADGSWNDAKVDYDSVEKSLALKSPYKLDFGSGKDFSLQIFHGLYDGNSLEMLLRCLVDEYRGAEVEYGPSFISSLPYGPLAQVSGAQEFWTQHLAGWTPNEIPTTSDSTSDIISTRTITNIHHFETLRKILSVTPQAVLQAAWLSALQTILSPNPTIGIVTSGRAIDFEGADKVIGPLFNTVPFHVELEDRMTSKELVGVCHEWNMEMQEFQHTPLKDVQRWSPAKIGDALFESLFVFQRGEVEGENGVWRKVDGGQIADYPLAFEATLSADSERLELTVVAQSGVLSQDEADGLLDAVEEALQEILRSEGKNVITTNAQDNKRTRDRPTSNGIATAPSVNGKFTWTNDAENIRVEIACLAKVSEDSIQEHSSIFELGLDSIDVIKLSSRLKKRGIEIPVSVIIKSQTIANMAGKISKGSNEKAPQRKTLDEMCRDLRAYLKRTGNCWADAETILPATPLQQSMVNEMIKSRYRRYFNVDGFKLGDGVDVERLIEAIRTVVDQSPILRTTFVEIADPKLPVTYAQIVHKSAYGGLHDSIIGLEEGDTFEAFMNNFKDASAHSASKSGSLLHVRRVVVGREQYLVIAISHALYDGTSLKSIHNDIERAYHDQLSQRPDFKTFLEQVFQSTSEDAKKFWRTTLSNLPPAQFPRKIEVVDREGSLRIERRSRLSLNDVETLCRSSRITLQTLGQTCWALVLSHLMGQLDVVFGSVLSCRDSEKASEVMFPLMNTVAVRSVLHGTLVEMLRYMQDMSDTTRQYQHFPLGTAQAYALASRQDSERKDTTLFDTLFIYQGRRSTKEEGKLYKSVYGASDVEFPVCAEMEIVDDEYISWTTACKSIARDAAETEGVIDALEAVLERIIKDSNAQTIVSDADGISVCGLPKFRMHKTEPKKEQVQIADGADAEWSSTEVVLRKALHEVSNVPESQIKKATSIFHLGLDSILVLKLPTLLKTYDIKLSVSEILREQTVVAMANAVSRSTPETNGTLDVDSVLVKSVESLDISSELEALEREVGEVAYTMPATAGEEYMIRQWRVSQGAMFYQTFTYTLPGPINKEGLENAWRTLLANHDILRTGFLEIESQIVQVVFKDPTNEVIYCSSGWPAPVTRKSNSDLRLPPLNLVVEDEDESPVTLKLVLHHAIYDGISLPILIDQLQSLYNGQTPEVSELGFKTFVAETISSSSTPTTKEKWTSYLLGETLYPTKALQSNTPSKTKNRTEVFHPSNKIVPLNKLAQSHGLTIDALFIAVIAKILARRLQSTSQEPTPQVTFGVYLANRAPFGDDLSSLAAPTLNLLPLRVPKPLDRKLEDVAADVQLGLGTIGEKGMVGASLREIYEWTGTRVNCFVNILKSANPGTGADGHEVGEWKAVHNLTTKAEVVEERINENVILNEGVWNEAYLVSSFSSIGEKGKGLTEKQPSLDIEMRYMGEKGELDVGVFAPNDLMDVGEAEKLVGEFVAIWQR
ncbi:related to non-ribosomal peptide synthetase [Phialocephala subalpina]|uniref:Related to non-ribosomal peptide synthetase n=1 Tax=Phialocephala subalpina TaxID=576137 RepID=A0A1L7XE09_9HELO|nr:related to non-ribosomal peptide synthetase [Phialocephala subalpina]